jgi:hypothetical protein
LTDAVVGRGAAAAALAFNAVLAAALVDLAVAVVIDEVAFFVASRNASVFASVEGVSVNIVIVLVTVLEPAGSTGATHRREGGYTDVWTGVDGAIRRATATVLRVRRDVMIFSLFSIAIVVHGVTTVSTSAEGVRRCLGHRADCLAAVERIAVGVIRPGEASFNGAVALPA